MTNRHELRTPANGSSPGEVEWPRLLGRMLEDLAHIFQLELRLVEAKVPPLMMAVADRAVAALLILYFGVIGGSCLLAALILLLHRWLVWWQCFAVGGVVTLVCALVAHISMSSSSAPTESKREANSNPSLIGNSLPPEQGR